MPGPNKFYHPSLWRNKPEGGHTMDRDLLTLRLYQILFQLLLSELHIICRTASKVDPIFYFEEDGSVQKPLQVLPSKQISENSQYHSHPDDTICRFPDHIQGRRHCQRKNHKAFHINCLHQP